MQNILVVEDDPDLNQAIGYALQKAGYGVYSTATIKGGEKLFRGNRMDMVLLDVNLSDGEGFSFCKWSGRLRDKTIFYENFTPKNRSYFKENDACKPSDF